MFDARHEGPLTEEANGLHEMKYRQRRESFREAVNRWAFGLKDDDRHYHQIREVLLPQRFLPGGRIQSAIGATREVSAYNCFSGDTEIMTDAGFLKLRDLVKKKVQVLSPVSGTFEEATVSSYGRQKLMQIVVSNSRNGQRRAGNFVVRATANHRWVLQSGTITDNLRVGNVLKAAGAKFETDIEGWVHGFMYGDGTRLSDGRYYIRLCGKKARHLPKFLEAFPNARVSYPPSNDGDPNVTFQCGNDLKAIPGYGEEPEYLAGFVDGLLHADGGFTNEKVEGVVFSGAEATVRWMRDHAVFAGYAPAGRAYEWSSEPTNFGERNYPIWIQRLRRLEDHGGFRVLAIQEEGTAEVFCAEEPLYQQLVLRNGLSTGNCIVAPTIADSYVDGACSIMEVAHYAAATMRMGCGIGYDFSTLRPRGSEVKRLESTASGPVSYMEIFDAVCRATMSAGHRRGAQMGVMRVDHPDIEEFVRAKQQKDAFTGFNFSVGVTDPFMEAALAGKPFWLEWGGRKYREIDAAELWEKIMRSTWDWAEPGVLFIDRINQENNLWYCETIAATNPCGEQPLPPNGACLLGSFNLVRYLRKKLGTVGVGGRGVWDFDFEQLEADIPVIVAAMDNVVDRSRYPLPAQRAEAVTKRRMGLGITGLANAGEACAGPYASAEFLAFEARVLETIRDETYKASALRAAKLGTFPYYDPEKYERGKFIATLGDEARELIAKYGIRNSHLTSIAPTGTISMAADNVSSGLEPVFSKSVRRKVHTPEGEVERDVPDFGVKFLGVEPVTASQLKPLQHVAALTTAARRVDSAVSKTINVPQDAPWGEFKEVYKTAWEGGAKGCTTYRAGGMREALLTEGGMDSCAIDPTTGRRDCA